MEANLNATGEEDGERSQEHLKFTDTNDGSISNPNFTVSADGANGSATIDAVTGAWSYAPDENFNGTDTFTVTVTDDDAHEETKDISITVNPVNDPATIWKFNWKC